MSGHTPWREVKAVMQQKFGCDCGHEGLEWMFHATDCPFRVGTRDPRRSFMGGPAMRAAWAQVTGMSTEPGYEDGADSVDDEESVKPADDRPWTTVELRSARSKAQGRAKTQLAHEFRMRYRALYRQELEREGLTVIRHRRVGWPAGKTIAREAASEQPPPIVYYDDHEHDDYEGDD